MNGFHVKKVRLVSITLDQLDQRPFMATPPKSKHWVFTINNYTQEDGDLLAAAMPNITYVIVGKEDEGTPHMQGYVVMKNRQRLTAMKKIMPRAHLEIKSKHSTYQECIDYCKKDGLYQEEGVPPQTNSKRLKDNWQQAFEAAKDGRIEDIPACMRVRYYHAWKRIQQDYPKRAKALTKTCGVWLWGPTGNGKTRTAWDAWPDAYPKMKNKWWNGYQGEATVVMEDVGHEHTSWLGPFLKEWADWKPFTCEIKGTSANIRPERFVVTSQYSLKQLFYKPEEDNETFYALKRRFISTHFNLNVYDTTLRYKVINVTISS